MNISLSLPPLFNSIEIEKFPLSLTYAYPSPKPKPEQIRAVEKFPLPLKDADYPSPKQIRARVSGTARKSAFGLFSSTKDAPYLKISKSWPYRGTYKTYPKYSNDIYWPSYVYVALDTSSGNNIVTGKVDDRTFSFKLPKGYSFGHDANGPKIFHTRRPKNDLHLDSELVFLQPSALRKMLLENAKKRGEAAKLEKAALWRQKQNEAAAKREFNSIIRNTVVFGTDAARAGNCEAGILGFARRHKINPKIGINAKFLWRAAQKESGDTQRRVKLSIFKANERETVISI